MTQLPTSQQIANLVPLNELDADTRVLLLPYTRLLSLAANEFMPADLDGHALHLLQGAVVPHGADDRAGAMVRAEAWQAFEPCPALTPCTRLAGAPGGAKLVRVDSGRVAIAAAWVAHHRAGPASALASDWLAALLRSAVLARLPAAAIRQVLERAQVRQVTAGTSLANQDELEREFFLVVEGGFSVHRQTGTGLDLTLAELTPGDSFGEEALLAATVRNASVIASSDSTVLYLSPEDFNGIIAPPLLARVNDAGLRAAMADGAVCLDVRDPDEAEDRPTGARNVPLLDIRSERELLSRERRYVVVCDTGRRSSAATFLLRAWGVNAVMLEGGLLGARAAAAGPDPAQAERALHAIIADEALEAALLEQLAQGEDAVEDSTDPALSARLASANQHLDEALRERAAVESGIRATREGGVPGQQPLVDERNRLHAELATQLEGERTALQAEYARATARIGALRERKTGAIQDAEKQIQALREALTTDLERLDTEAAEVHRALLRCRDAALARESALRSEHARRDAALCAQMDEQLRARRTELESTFARSLARVQVAEARLRALQIERQEGKRRSTDSAGKQRDEHEARRRELRERLAAANLNAGPPTEAVAADTEVESVASLDGEVQALLRDERQRAEARAAEAHRRLDFVAARDREAREEAEAAAAAERELLTEIDSLLRDPGTPSAMEAYAEQVALLSRRTRGDHADERRAAEAALRRARAHIDRLRDPDADA